MKIVMRTRARSLAPLMLLLLGACSARRNAEIEIPDGYVGWVTIRFDDEACPSGRSTAHVSVISVNEQGFGCLSTWNGTKGLTTVRYYYVGEHGVRQRELQSTGWGKGGELWAMASTPAEKLSHIFVGSEAAFKATKTGPPDPPGPLRRP